MPDNTTKSQKVKLSEILKNYGAGYVLVRPPGQRFRTRQGERVATGKEPLRGGWQKSPVSLSEALNWARRGGNVGLLGGTGELILLDADANADRIEEIEPRLRQTVRIVRANAPDRRKWIVRIAEGPLPASQKAHGVLEILAAGTQGVIFGRHHSGAQVEHDGDQIVTLTGDDIARIWRLATGEAMVQPAHTQHVEPDADAVRRAMERVDAVLEHGGIRRTDWRPYDGGVKAIFPHCPFNPTDDPHPDDEASVVIVYADGHIGATCHHARCQERIHQHGGGGWALLKELVGWQPQPAPSLEHVRTIVDYLREWVRRADLAEHVPPVLQAVNGYRTRDTDTAVADAILDVAWEHGRLDNLILTTRDLRLRCNLGSTSTASNALARLTGWFVVPSEQDNGWRRYAIHPALRGWAEDQIDLAAHVAQIERGSSINDLDHLPTTTRSIYATSPLVTHRRRDAFSAPMRPMTEEELAERIEQRNAEIAAGLDVRPIQRSRYRRRLAALLPSPGRTVLRLIDALAVEGGLVERRTLRDLLNLSPSALSRTVARAAELGLVLADRHTVRLRENWQQLVDDFEPLMPTAQRALDREYADLNATIRFAQLQLRKHGADHQRLERRIGRCKKRKQEIAAMQRPDLEHRHADQAPPSAKEMTTWRRLGERLAQARIDLAAERRADSWRLFATARQLRQEGVGLRDAWRMLSYAGWQYRELSSCLPVVWASSAPVPWQEVVDAR